MYKVIRRVLPISDNTINSIIKDVASIIGNGININDDIILKALIDKSLRNIVFYKNERGESSPYKIYNKNKLYDARSGSIHIHFNRDIANIISHPKVLRVLKYILSTTNEIKYLHSLPPLIIHPSGYTTCYYMKIKVIKDSILGIMCISNSIIIRMINGISIKPDIIRDNIKYYKDPINDIKYYDITLNKGDIFTWNPSTYIKFIKPPGPTSISIWLNIYNSNICIPDTGYRIEFDKCKCFLNDKLINIDEFNYRIDHQT